MSVQSFDNFNLLIQVMATTRNLGKSMRDNANTHLAMAAAQSPDVVTLAGYVNDCAASYLNIINTATTWVQNNSAQMSAAVGLIGATNADLQSYANPLKTAATNLQAADKSTYAAITTACNALLSAVTAPASIFGA